MGHVYVLFFDSEYYQGRNSFLSFLAIIQRYLHTQ